MATQGYAAGLQFVVTTPLHAVDKYDRRVIKGHTTRARKNRGRMTKLRSWICPSSELQSLNASNCDPPANIPGRAGTDFSGLQLPAGIEPSMIQELVKFIDLGKQARYPCELCFDVPPVERGWFPYMISDACCLHSMMFSVRLLDDNPQHFRLNPLACYHYAQTLQLLQARLYELDQTCATSDATIMVVTTLASIAELMSEYTTAGNHIRGLEKIVALRGGVRALNTHTNMPVKVCRADLSFAISSGTRPFFLREGISWDCFLADRGILQCSHFECDLEVQIFMKAMKEPQLRNLSKDVHALSCISNLAVQSNRKLSTELYNEMMISVLYRLMHLAFDDDHLQEVIRLGLLCFCSTVFMQRQYMKQTYSRLLDSFSRALNRLRRVLCKGVPIQMVFWLLMMWKAVTRSDGPEYDTWLKDVINQCNFDSWAKAKESLRSIAWIDFIHDQLGQRAFDAAKCGRKGLQNASCR